MNETPETIPSTQLKNLSDYLNDITSNVPELHLSVLPKAIGDCASVFLEYKKMKIDSNQFNKKCKIINNYLQNQAKNQKKEIQSNHKTKMAQIDADMTKELTEAQVTDHIESAKTEASRQMELANIEAARQTELAKTAAVKEMTINGIRTYKETKITEINEKTKIALSEIEQRTQVAMEAIKRQEAIKIMELENDYDLKKMKLDTKKYEFDQRLKEESKKFQSKYSFAIQEQKQRHQSLDELRNVCRFIGGKIQKGKASAKDYEFYGDLMNLQIALLSENNNFVQSICRLFTEEIVNC